MLVLLKKKLEFVESKYTILVMVRCTAFVLLAQI